MPHSTTLELLVRKSELSDESWLQLIEARREMVKRYLDSFTLGEIGSLECLRRENSYHKISDNEPTLIKDPWNGHFSLKTQGIFGWKVERASPPNGTFVGNNFFANGKVHIWGLTRSSLWILADLSFVGEHGRKNRGYDKAISIEIQEASLSTILTKLKIRPRLIWDTIGESVYDLTHRRKILYEQALELIREIELEDRVVDHITAEPD